MPDWAVNGVKVFSDLAVVKEKVEQTASDLCEVRVALTRTLAELQEQHGILSRSLAVLEEGHRVRCERCRQVENRVHNVQQELPPKLGKRLAAIERLIPLLKLLSAVGTALIVSIVGLLWALLTGQAQIVFK